MGWDFPKQGSLKERIDLSGLHPVTCLTTLTKKEKQFMLDNRIILCKDINSNENLLAKAGINPYRLKGVVQEAIELSTV
jgi:hypothetical protein